MKRIITIVILFSSMSANAQWGDEQLAEKSSFKDRIFFGGSFGLSFNKDYDFISLSPGIGYQLNQRLAVGTSIIYRHTTYKYITPKISTNDYGVSPFLRFQLYGPLFLHAEYEYLNNQYVTYSGETIRANFSSFMAGGGFFKPIARRAGFFAIALYNFSFQNPSSNLYYPYSSPLVLRAGITAGF